MKIWKVTDLDVEPNSPLVKTTLFDIDHYLNLPRSPRSVAIIGAGPKGFYGLQSLIAKLKEEDYGVIDIHWFNADGNFGNGSLFDLYQPEYLITNFAIGNIDLWKTTLEEDDQPQNLTSWIKERVSKPEEVRDEDFASRALVGYYYQSGLKKILKSLPKRIRLHLIKAKVTDIVPSTPLEKYRLELDGEYQQYFPQYDHILVATGHSEKPVTNDGLAKFGLISLNAKYIPHIFPVEQQLSTIEHLHKVSIRGMGLTSIDAILALTEGRGGEFVRKGNEISYQPSGREPLGIYPFSLSGIPMCPRPPKTHAGEPYFVNQALVEELSEDKDKIDFETQVLPHIKKELEAAHYISWAKRKGYLQSSTTMDSKSVVSFVGQAMEKDLDIPPFSMDTFLDPWVGFEDINASQYHMEVVNYMKRGLQELAQGTNYSPLLAKMDVCRNIMPFICQLYQFGGFTPASQQRFDEYYHPRFSKFAYGPPSIQIEKLLALCHAGILFFRLGRETEVSTVALTGKYKLTSYQTKYCKEVDVLIDARMPKINLSENPSILFQNLLKRKLGNVFKNKKYCTGGMAINEGGNLLSRKGQATSNIYLNGNPTEGVTLDNDSLCKVRNDFSLAWAKAVVGDLKKSASYALEK